MATILPKINLEDQASQLDQLRKASTAANRTNPRQAARAASALGNGDVEEVHQDTCMTHGYRLENVNLGSGSYASRVVRAVVQKSKLKKDNRVGQMVLRSGHVRVAIKIVDKHLAPKKYVEKFMPREIAAMKKVSSHPNVINFYEAFETDRFMYMVIEYCPNGNLMDYIKARRGPDNSGVGEVDSRRLFTQVVAGLKHCHEQGYVHRDLKCENLLLDCDNNVKISDFGFSRLKPPKHGHYQERMQTPCGSLGYVSPEVMSYKRYDGEKTDIWASGVVLFMLANGELPWNERSIRNMDTETRLQRHRFHPNLSIELMLLLKRIMQHDPNNRPSLAEILDDPWMKGETLSNTDLANQYTVLNDKAISSLTAKKSVQPKLPALYPNSSILASQRKLASRVPISTLTGETVTLQSRIPGRNKAFAFGELHRHNQPIPVPAPPRTMKVKAAAKPKPRGKTEQQRLLEMIKTKPTAIKDEDALTRALLRRDEQLLEYLEQELKRLKKVYEEGELRNEGDLCATQSAINMEGLSGT